MRRIRTLGNLPRNTSPSNNWELLAEPAVFGLVGSFGSRGLCVKAIVCIVSKLDLDVVLGWGLIVGRLNYVYLPQRSSVRQEHINVAVLEFYFL